VSQLQEIHAINKLIRVDIKTVWTGINDLGIRTRKYKREFV